MAENNTVPKLEGLSVLGTPWILEWHDLGSKPPCSHHLTAFYFILSINSMKTTIMPTSEFCWEMRPTGARKALSTRWAFHKRWLIMIIAVLTQMVRLKYRRALFLIFHLSFSYFCLLAHTGNGDLAERGRWAFVLRSSCTFRIDLAFQCFPAHNKASSLVGAHFLCRRVTECS